MLAHTEQVDEVAALGARVREFREARGLSVRKLAALAGVSASFLSQFERGLCNASIGTIRQLAQALGLNTADLFDLRSVAGRRLVRREDRPALPTAEGTRKFLISTPPAKHSEVYTAELDPGARTSEEPYAHGESTEILYVISGVVRCIVGDESIEMFEGDSVEYSTAVPHMVTNGGSDLARVLWVISPPSTSETHD